MKHGIQFCMGFAVMALAIAALPATAADEAVLRNGFSIRHERREVIGSVTRLFVTADGSSYVDVPTAEIERFEADPVLPSDPPAPATASAPALNTTDLSQVVFSASDRYRLDPDLVNSVIHAESGFNPRAVSPKGAHGLMQLMPQTASRLGVPNSFDPQANVEGGTRYLRELLERYHFDLIKALAAYNAGPERVERFRGVPPYFETRAYVARVVRDFNRKKLAERGNAGIATHKGASSHASASSAAASAVTPSNHLVAGSSPKTHTPAELRSRPASPPPSE